MKVSDNTKAMFVVVITLILLATFAVKANAVPTNNFEINISDKTLWSSLRNNKHSNTNGLTPIKGSSFT